MAVVIALSYGYLIFLSMSPYQEAKKTGEDLAKEYAQLTKVDEVSLYNGLSSYYSVLGERAQSEKVAVLIDKNDQKIYVYQLDKGISREEAERLVKNQGKSEVSQVTFGRYQEKPVWEVHTGNEYVLVDFETGQLVKKEDL